MFFLIIVCGHFHSQNALMHATSLSRYEIMELIVSTHHHLSVVDIVDEVSHVSIRNMCLFNNTPTLYYLLFYSYVQDGRSALFEAISPNCARLLIDGGANVNLKDNVCISYFFTIF